MKQITNDIKIEVKTKYNGVYNRDLENFHAFSYDISIKNNSKDTIQLLARFWEIYDALNDKIIVSGKGVIGQTPIIKSNNSFSYRSNCFINATIGAMKGHYTMFNLNSSKKISVSIPNFQLIATSILN